MIFQFDLQPIRGGIVLLGEILVGLTVAFCLVRGLPVLWEGRRYLERFAAARSSASARRSLRPAGVASR